jgi:type IV secretory pathway VirB10-like protein
MTEEPEEQTPAPTPVVSPDLRLRGERPRVTRLSRKVLITLGAVSALAVAGALGYALQTRNKSQTGQELLSTQNRPSAEGLAGLPKDYTGLPRQAPPLGPPLPGDLGKPILNAGAAPNTAVSATTPDPAAQRLAQETEAARVSRLFAQTNQQPQPVSLVAPPATATQSGVQLRRRRSMPGPLRTCRIARRRSSTQRRISERSAPTVSKPRLRPISCRREP